MSLTGVWVERAFVLALRARSTITSDQLLLPHVLCFRTKTKHMMVTNVKLVPSPEADGVAVTRSQSLMPCRGRSRPTVPSSVLRFSKVLVDESTSRTEPGGGVPGNHPQGLRSGIRCTGSPDGEPRQSSRERSTLRQNEGTVCDLRYMT